MPSRGWSIDQRDDISASRENGRPADAVHRSIVVVDVEGFGNQARTNPHQLEVRAGLYRALSAAFKVAGVPWERCYREDRGDGAFVLVPADVPKVLLCEVLPVALSTAVAAHNRNHPHLEQVRLRMALHAGEVAFDAHGVTAASIIFTFRLLDAPVVKAALAASPGVLVLVVSPWFFDEVVRHSPASKPEKYEKVTVKVKETKTLAWIYQPLPTLAER
jgi:hypothetical protein